MYYDHETWIKKHFEDKSVEKSNKGIWWMPRHKKTMKDAAACDKPRLGGKQPLSRGYPNGVTFPQSVRESVPRTHIGMRRVPGELKHLSSRRKREKYLFPE